MAQSSSIEAEIGLCLLFSAVDGEISEQELAALTDRVGQLLGDDFDPMRLPGLLEGEMGSIEDSADHLARRIRTIASDVLMNVPQPAARLLRPD